MDSEKQGIKGEMLAREFLQALYSSEDNGFLTIWTSSDKQTRWYEIQNIEAAVSDAMELRDKQNVYFGVGVRKEKLSDKQRGTNKDIFSLPAVWVEIDTKDGTHAADNLPDLEAAKAILNTFSLSPSIINHSGGGIHCYWLFDQSVRIRSEKDQQGSERMLRRFQDVFIRLARTKGLRIDKTSDLARVLRVPGTFNLKSEPKPVQTLKIEPDCRYSLLELRDAIEEMESVLPAEQGPIRVHRDYEETDLPDAKAEPIVKGCQFIQQYLNSKDTATYAEWMAALSIGAHCEGAEDVCHSWSQGHGGYSEVETDRKINEIRERMKPRTCASINEEFGTCTGCRHLNKINSPIALGMKKNPAPKKETHEKKQNLDSQNETHEKERK